VRSEIAWQRIVNGLFGSRIRISDAQINETINRLSANASQPNYRVAEIYIEATPDIGGMDGAMEGARAMIQQVGQGAPFPLLAQQFSSAPTAAKGGDVGWVGGVYVIALLDKQISESDTVYKLKQVNVPVKDPGEMDAAVTRLTELKTSLTSCESLTKDVNAQDNLASADMGEIKTSDMAETMLNAIDDIEINGLSDPIETARGPVAIMVCDRRITGKNIPTRDEVENRLTDQQICALIVRVHSHLY